MNTNQLSAHILGRIVDRLIPIFREDASRTFSTDLARDIHAMMVYTERGDDRCYWSCYGAGSTIRPMSKRYKGQCVPTNLNVSKKSGEDSTLWFDAGTNEPIDVYEINLVTGVVTKLRHVTKCSWSYVEDGDRAFYEVAP